MQNGYSGVEASRVKRGFVWPSVQVWVRDVREAVELLDEATGQRVPKEQVRALSPSPLDYIPHTYQPVNPALGNPHTGHSHKPSSASA